MSFEKLKVSEVIVVEGRDDTNAVLRAIDGITIETHGFGIRPETWNLLEKAYKEKGLIVFTDPDFAGEEIRRRINARFPECKQAYLTRKEAEKKGDIGIENASPEDIARAIEHVHFTKRECRNCYTEADLLAAGLVGDKQSAAKREQVGSILGIGYGNGRTFLKKLNQFDIPREDFDKCIEKLNAEREA